MRETPPLWIAPASLSARVLGDEFVFHIPVQFVEYDVG
jgi:hypothetical protein